MFKGGVWLFDLQECIYFEIPYWFNKRLGIDIYYRQINKGKRWRMSILFLHRLFDVPGYEDEWGFKECKHFDIWPLKLR